MWIRPKLNLVRFRVKKFITYNVGWLLILLITYFAAKHKSSMQFYFKLLAAFGPLKNFNSSYLCVGFKMHCWATSSTYPNIRNYLFSHLLRTVCCLLVSDPHLHI
jgi:hypothetical protein